MRISFKQLERFLTKAEAMHDMKSKPWKATTLAPGKVWSVPIYPSDSEEVKVKDVYEDQ